MDCLNLPQLASAPMVPWLIHLAGSVTKTINDHTPTDRLGQNPLFERHVLPLINQYLGPKPFILAIPDAVDVGTGNGKLYACTQKDLYIFDPKTRVLDKRRIFISKILLCARVRNNCLFVLTLNKPGATGIIFSRYLAFEIIDLSTFEFTFLFRPNNLDVEMFEVHPNGKLIYFLCPSTIQIHDLSGKLATTLPLKRGKIATIFPFCFDSEGNFLAPAIDQGDDSPQKVPVYREAKLVRELILAPASFELGECCPVQVKDQKYIEHLQLSIEGELSIVDHTGVVLRVLPASGEKTTDFSTIPGYAAGFSRKNICFHRI